MSYILDALRKAEHERAQSAAPAAAWQPTEPAAETRSGHYRPILLGVLCLLLVAALLVTSAHDRSVARETALAAAGAAAATAATEAQTTNAPASTDEVDAGSDTAQNLAQQNAQTLDDVMGNDADPDVADEQRAALSTMVVHPDAPTTAPTAESQATDVTDPAPATPATAPPAAVPAPEARVTEVERVQLQPAPPLQVTKLRDMPAAYRAAFPLLNLDVHSYDASPKKRFIMMGGRRYNEGDTLADGARIVRIVSDGVVFEFRGEQVLFTIAH